MESPEKVTKYFYPQKIISRQKRPVLLNTSKKRHSLCPPYRNNFICRYKKPLHNSAKPPTGEKIITKPLWMFSCVTSQSLNGFNLQTEIKIKVTSPRKPVYSAQTSLFYSSYYAVDFQGLACVVRHWLELNLSLAPTFLAVFFCGI